MSIVKIFLTSLVYVMAFAFVEASVVIVPRTYRLGGGSSIRSNNSFSIKTTSRMIELSSAKSILQNTNIITSPFVGECGAVSEQALAFASILYYVNKSTARVAARELFANAQTSEARIYGLMAIYSLLGKNEYDRAVENVDFNSEVNTIFAGKFRKIKIGEFFEAFFRNPSLFVPKSDILKTKVSAEVGTTPPIIYVSPPPIIINTRQKK